MIDKKYLGKIYKIKNIPSDIGFDTDCGVNGSDNYVDFTWSVGDDIRLAVVDEDDSIFYFLNPDSSVGTTDSFFEKEVRRMIDLSDNKNQVVKTKEEKKAMNANKMFKDFGQVNDGSLAMTLNGQIAVKVNDGEYIRFNKDNNTMENQMDLVIEDVSDFIYIMPVATVEVEDIIKHNDSYFQILSNNDDGSLNAIKLKDGTKETIIKETNIMGFNYFYKVTSMFPNQQTNASTDSMNPMMMMLMMGKDKDSSEKSTSMRDIMMMQAMSSQGDSGQTLNPMMMMMMMGDDNFDMKTLMLMNMMNGNTKKITGN
jgi:hypothetical protein